MEDNLSRKSITWMVLVVIFVNISCLLLYHYPYNNYQILVATPDQDSKHSSPPQAFSFRKANIMIPSPSSHHDESNTEGDLSFPSFKHKQGPRQGYNIPSSADSVPENPSSPAGSVPRNQPSLVSLFGF